MALPISGQAQEFTFFEHTKKFGINSVTHGDLNSDGKVDFITDSDVGWKSYIGLDTSGDIDFEVFSDNLVLRRLEIFDMDSDGDNDIIASATTEDKTIIFYNDGNANFQKVETDLPSYDGITFDDIDKDGVSEMILTQNDEIRIINLPDLTIDFVITDGTSSFRPSYIQSLDYNKDGLLDLIVLDNKSDILVFYQNEQREFSKTVLHENLYNIDQFYISNLNQDGLIDFVVYGLYSLKQIALISTSMGSFEEVDIPALKDNISWLSVGDLDNDSFDEILMLEGNHLSEVTSLAKYNNSSGTFDINNLSSNYSNTRRGGIADVNNDGLKDFYFYSRVPSGKFVIALQSEDMTTGIHELANTKIEIYPNPVSDVLNIDIDGHLDFKVSIYNLSGKLVTSSINKRTIDVSFITQGSYLLELKDQKTGQKIVDKIIIGK